MRPLLTLEEQSAAAAETERMRAYFREARELRLLERATRRQMAQNAREERMRHSPTRQIERLAVAESVVFSQYLEGSQVAPMIRNVTLRSGRRYSTTQTAEGLRVTRVA